VASRYRAHQSQASVWLLSGPYWLRIIKGCEVSVPDLRTLKAHPEFLHHFDKLTDGNTDRILEAAAVNAEQKGYGKRQRDKDAGG
jgi:hypothetical protein